MGTLRALPCTTSPQRERRLGIIGPTTQKVNINSDEVKILQSFYSLGFRSSSAAVDFEVVLDHLIVLVRRLTLLDNCFINYR